MTELKAYAKINLALVVGPPREDRLHEVVTVVQRIDLADSLVIEETAGLRIEGFPGDTLVRTALGRLAEAAGVAHAWRLRIDKHIPVAAGLGGGSADAGVVLAAANAALPRPLPSDALVALAASVGSDVPFFLEPGPKLVEGAGERLTPLDLPQDYSVVIVVPGDRTKTSTGEVYRRFDELGGGAGFDARRAGLLEALAAGDLAALPPNDLAEAAGVSPIVDELRDAGAFRADLSGAGPAVFGLFEDLRAAESAARAIGADARAWVARPVW